MSSRALGAFLAVVCAFPGSAAHLTGGEQQGKFPPELVHFVPYRGNPVFTAENGKWDTRIRERGWIMREDGVYKLWYTGYDGTPEGLRMLGYATSTDGIRWTRHPRNPLLKDVWVEDMMVVKHEGKYYMFAEGRHDRAHLLVS